MESLRNNKALLYSILGAGGTVLALTLGIIPELSAQFELIEFPPDVSVVSKSVDSIIIGFSSNFSSRLFCC